MLFLATPSEAYKHGYISSVREFQAEGGHLQDNLNTLSENFGVYVQYLLSQTDPTRLKPGWVPASYFWLIDGDQYIGQLSIRHELNDHLLQVGGNIGYEIRPSKRRRGYGKEILRLGLEKARELGLHRVLVTCDEDNIGSKKIIEANGGKFENALKVKGERAKKLRYWIDIHT